MKRRIQLAIAIFLMAAPAFEARGQTAASGETARLEVTLAYSAMRSNGSTGACACFWMQGGKAEFSAAFGESFSLVGELASEHASDINSAHEDLDLVSFMFGPRYSYRRYRRITPFAQALIGGVHGFNAYFPNPLPPTNSAEGIALSAGGGLNMATSRRFSIRLVQMDYLQTHLPNNLVNRENSLRVGAGIVFLFERPRARF